jgi:putative intracellular protease/amidase
MRRAAVPEQVRGRREVEEDHSFQGQGDDPVRAGRGGRRCSAAISVGATWHESYDTWHFCHLPAAGVALRIDVMSENSILPLTEIVVFDGFDDLDAIAPLEILVAAGFPARVVRPSAHPSTVHSAHGLVLQVSDALSDAPGLVLVPGGGWLDGTAGVRTQCEGPLPTAVAALHDAGTVVASVCTGAMLVARAGLLAGRPAVTNRQALDDLAAAGADVRRDARVVDDGSVVTAGGPAAGIDLAVHLVARFAGETAGRAAAERLEHVPVGPVLVGVGAR